MTQKNRLSVSIAAIVAYWIFAAFIATHETFPPADDLRAIVTSILVTKFVTLGVILLLMLFEQESFTRIGFDASDVLKKVFTGMMFGTLIWIIVHIVVNPTLKAMLPANAAQSVNMAAYFREPFALLVWIPLVIFAGGFVEELQRIFILTRFEKWLKAPGLILSLIIGTIVFGLGHLYQGPNGAISAGVSGLLFAFVYLRKRSAWEAIAAHGFYDVIGVVVGFAVSRG